jgi:hypothetical protein
VEKLQSQLAFKEQELKESQEKATLLAEANPTGEATTSTFISNLQVCLGGAVATHYLAPA